MIVTKKAIVSMRYAMRNGKGEVLTSLQDSPPFTFLPGSGTVLPELEADLLGMAVGDKKSVFISKEKGFANLDDDFYFDIIIDNIREATEEEILQGQPVRETSSEECRSDCACRCQNSL